jgi:hypothetical protein
MRGGGKPEEMIVYIAPLKIQKFECPSSPILVAIFYRGKMYAKSSLDIVSDGKNTVEIDVNEYYFLCRGKFDDKGQFRSFINTTGISATQRDILTIISRDSQPVLPGERLGHLKLPYNPVVSDGTGNIEIFPLDPEDNEFVIIVSNKEFVDYYFMTDDRNKGLQRVLINDTDGRKELVCNWDGGFLEAELIDG